MAATTAVYNFWLYELCDVFIVCSSFIPVKSLEFTKNVIVGSDETHD
jgi:hypothetical protein